MKRSEDRILTTHAGSLPRPADLLELIRAKEHGGSYDRGAYAARVRSAVAAIVDKQVRLRIDVVDDGEMGKPGFIPYVNERLAGFEVDRGRSGSPFAGSREFKAFPEFYEWFGRALPSPAASLPHMVCTGPISYKGHAQVRADIDNLKAALAGRDVEEAFLPAISPAGIEEWQKNRYYRTDEEYLYAIAEAMREEYRAIVDAGLLLQIDDPRIATYYALSPDRSIKQIRKWAAERIAALNHALRGIPRERIRWHTCYGINIGPRVHDMELKDFIDIVLKVRAGAYSFEAANPRHEHEWSLWKNVKLPDGTVLIPGVITQSNVMVEHPQLIAERIVRFASAVGRENIIAGADCGFGTFAGSQEIHESVVWAKFSAMAEGARIASERLWKKGSRRRASSKFRTRKGRARR
ncbi:MAG TPA: cobalamin-independent methionine synthase II family protein [Burkholderiales bacterium]|nr:cobalamin-independent methionine synthase II family protein [Burkholderiales bacterium]